VSPPVISCGLLNAATRGERDSRASEDAKHAAMTEVVARRPPINLHISLVSRARANSGM
jgi:hypothetical protein